MGRLLIAILVLSGCAGSQLPLPPHGISKADAERTLTVATAFAVWESLYGPAPNCVFGYEGLHWRQLEDEAFDAACAAGMYDGRDACTELYGGMTLITIRARPWSRSALASLRAHELGHWLQHCSDREPDGDPDHSDVHVWPQHRDRTLEAMGL